MPPLATPLLLVLSNACTGSSPGDSGALPSAYVVPDADLDPPALPAPGAAAAADLAPALSSTFRCGTALYLPSAPPIWPALPAPPPAAPVGEKLERDAYSVAGGFLRSTNFIARWGDDGDVDPDQVQSLLDAFEVTWTAEIVDMGHTPPHGTETYLFNIYIGDTGGGTPDSNGAGGYYTLDRDGMPMIVIAAGSMWNDQYREEVTAHEFYHAIQSRAGSYPYTGASAWYWEATAEWAGGEVFPENPSYAQFLFGYAFLPELSVEYFDYPDTGTLSEYHQYGAFVFPRFLSERVADRSIIVDSWKDPTGSTPLATLTASLAARGLDIKDVFGDFAAHNSAWDYEDGGVYAAALRDAWFDGSELVDTVSKYGTDGWVDAPTETLPTQWGYNVVAMSYPAAGDVTISFEGEGEGSRRSVADWRVTVVSYGPVYTPIELTDGAGEITLPDGGGTPRIQLVVAAVPDSVGADETFAWRYQIDVAADPVSVEEATEGEDEESACGCRREPTNPGPYAALLLPLLGWRRRADPRSPPG